MLAGKLFTRGYSSRPVPEEKIVLDEQQEVVVKSTSPNILVVAGAGSGKTRVLTERVKHLMLQGVPPHNIVAITFTNLASEEMKERLKEVDNVGDAFIGTIHSFANKIMQASGEKYKLYNDEVDILYHKELIDKYCKHLTIDRYVDYKDLLSDLALGKVSEYAVKTFLRQGENMELSMLRRKTSEVEKEIEIFGNSDYPECIEMLCKRNNVITFDELLIKADAYFRSIDAKVEHLLVDEFQDVGTLEFQFIKGLNATNNFFVGDDYQSIYGFKGGNVHLFLQLVRDESFDVHYLTNNYRNGREVLQTADIVISQVGNKIPKEVVPLVDKEGEVVIMSKLKLREALSQITDYKNWFILTRTNKELFDIVRECKALGIPCITFKREGLTLAELRANMHSNKVKVLTVHTSKGLEADNVLLYGNFPLHCSPYRVNEEERKVMYVGVTRAREKLIILN